MFKTANHKNHGLHHPNLNANSAHNIVTEPKNNIQTQKKFKDANNIDILPSKRVVVAHTALILHAPG